MTNILDAVEPTAYRYNKVRGLDKEPFGTEYSEAPPRQNPGLTEQCSSVDQLYSRETVERLLAEHRKQVLLEAQAAHDHEDVLAPVGNSAYGEAYQDGWIAGTAAYRDELRRMAEGEK